ncbi:hypothetical protein TBS_18740 [Thermobispora bispora]|uniref:AAA family ATPase n=1 Tax=Thermobispora bispora TaxID=2006 RepID=UPI0030E953A5
MLLRFRVANYASLRDEQELSLVALDDHDDLAVRRPIDDDLSVLPAAAVYGGNASGKSNLLEAMHFMQEAVCHSHLGWGPEATIPRNSFRFDDDIRRKPSEFCVDIAVDGVHYEYGFAVDDEVVRSEWLYCFVKRQRRVRRVLFERSGPEWTSIRFGGHLKGRKRAIAEFVRPNSLYLSVAAANNHPQLTKIYGWFSNQMIYIDAGVPVPHLPYTLHLAATPDRSAVLDLLNYADLGISDIRQEPLVLDNELRDRFMAVLKVVDPDRTPDLGFAVEAATRVDFIHRVRGKEYALPLENESSGTRSWFALLGPILEALAHGMVLVVDELNAFLHPLLVSELVNLFQDPTYNRQGAQLVFNTHDSFLLSPLSKARLRRDQVWLTDRDEDGATTLRPLTDYRVRDGLDSVFRGYLLGRYRGIPIFDEGLLEELILRHTHMHGDPPRKGSETEAGELT